MQPRAYIEYLAAGGNRHPAAADWDKVTGLLAFGAGRNLALWKPQENGCPGLEALLSGHQGDINAVKFCHPVAMITPLILSGSVDKTIRIWQEGAMDPETFSEIGVLRGHTGSVNCIAVSGGEPFLASGASDGTIKIWKVAYREGRIQGTLIHSLNVMPRTFPLSIALQTLGASGGMILAFAGTSNSIGIYVATKGIEASNLDFQGSLVGHEDWIRSLEFVREDDNSEDSDFLLASASQDKSIRIWRLHRTIMSTDPSLASSASYSELSLSGKALIFNVSHCVCSFTFEALMLGHEDWIYTAKWNKRIKDSKPQLLTASADGSLSVWESEPFSGIWICHSRLGEISAQKGSTTATGSPGGFWIGLWSKDGSSVVGLGRTGSWRRWDHDIESNKWRQMLGVTGHTLEAKGCSWSSDGKYLLSVSTDQTTRLHSQWVQGNHSSWHEFGRPQIHGYNINCIAIQGQSRFVSGAAEKVVRVFDEPRAAAEMRSKLSGIVGNIHYDLPEMASIPVLGLSNKAKCTSTREFASPDSIDPVYSSGDLPKAPLMHLGKTAYPSTEDVLARHTLWPEREKLYGHGYEISAVTSSHDGSLVATACKASSFEHAVIRLYETREWQEIKPALSAHSLTVTCIQFSADDRLLLSVGRDRQWTVFSRNQDKQNTYSVYESNPKGHSKMILSGAWAPIATNRVFATAGRDKCIKFWTANDNEFGQGFSATVSIATSAAVTTISFMTDIIKSHLVLASGLDSGSLYVYFVDASALIVKATHKIEASISPLSCVTQVGWQPQDFGQLDGREDAQTSKRNRLAVSSDDGSIRIFSIRID